MAYMLQVTVDSGDPHALADWWAVALEWDVQQPDEQFIRRMISEGHASQADTTTRRDKLVWKDGAAIIHPGGTGTAPRVYFQRVPEGKVAKNRTHLDIRIEGDEVADVVERLKAAGATFLHEGRQGPHKWVTLADPEGNEFCVSR